MTINNFERLGIEAGFSIYEKNESKLCLGKFTGVKLNGQRITKEIHVDIEKSTINLSIGGKQFSSTDIVDAAYGSLNNVTFKHLLATFNILEQCQGVDNGEYLKKSEDQVSMKWEIDGQEKNMIQHQRCLGFLQLKHRVSYCILCAALLIQGNDRSDPPEQWFDHQYCKNHITLKRKRPENMTIENEIIYEDEEENEINTNDDDELADPTYDPNYAKSSPGEKVQPDEIISKMFQEYPSLKEKLGEDFLRLLSCQIVNASVSDKHLRKWSPE